MDKTNFSLKKIISFVKSKEMVFIALLFALITQLKHSIVAYAYIDSLIFNPELKPIEIKPTFLGYLEGFIFSLSVSVAIMIFTFRGRKNIAYFFLAVEIFVNGIYSRLFQDYNLYILSSIIFLGIIIPVTITAYAHENEHDIEENEFSEKQNLQDKLNYNELKDKLNYLESFNNEVNKNLSNKIDKNKELSVNIKTDSGVKNYSMKIIN